VHIWGGGPNKNLEEGEKDRRLELVEKPRKELAKHNEKENLKAREMPKDLTEKIQKEKRVP